MHPAFPGPAAVSLPERIHIRWLILTHAVTATLLFKDIHPPVWTKWLAKGYRKKAILALLPTTISPWRAFMPRLICYCFGHTEEDLRRDVLEHGRSLIMERIVSAKKGGQCRCAEKNPAGR